MKTVEPNKRSAVDRSSAADPVGGATDIESLKASHRQLDTQRIAARANLENAERQLDALRAEARQAYGTDDLDALRQKLQDMRSENEQKRAAYQAHLEEIRQKLQDVESKYAEGKPGLER